MALRGGDLSSPSLLVQSTTRHTGGFRTKMEAIVRSVDVGVFQALLKFAQACGCEVFTLRNYQSEQTVGISKLPSSVYSKLLPFLAERQCGPPAYVLTAVLNSQTAHVLAAMLSTGCETRLALNVGRMLTMTLPPASARMSLSDFEAEALFRRGVQFDFRCTDQDSWQRFESEHVIIDAPVELSLRPDDFDEERWLRFGISCQTERRRRAVDPHILQWWTPDHDELLVREIKNRSWKWWPPLDQIVLITPAGLIESFKANHPACRTLPWDYVLRKFAVGRASAIGLVDQITPKAAWVRCLLCDRILHQTRSYFFTSPEQSFFCYPCVREHWWSAESDLARTEIQRYVRGLAESIQRVPHQDFGKLRADFAGLSAAQIAAVLRLIKKKPSRDSIKERFGTWFHALVAAGVLPSGSQQMERGIRSVAQDGHICLSLGERTICDLLFRYGVGHEREVPYPGDRPFRSDWRVGSVFVEYLGLSGDPAYDRTAREKERILQSYGVDLIKVYPKDLSSRATLLRKLQPILPQDDGHTQDDRLF